MFARQRNAKQVVHAGSACKMTAGSRGGGEDSGGSLHPESSCLCIFYLIRVSGVREERMDLPVVALRAEG